MVDKFEYMIVSASVERFSLFHHEDPSGTKQYDFGNWYSFWLLNERIYHVWQPLNLFTDFSDLTGLLQKAVQSTQDSITTARLWLHGNIILLDVSSLFVMGRRRYMKGPSLLTAAKLLRFSDFVSGLLQGREPNCSHLIFGFMWKMSPCSHNLSMIFYPIGWKLHKLMPGVNLLLGANMVCLLYGSYDQEMTVCFL